MTIDVETVLEELTPKTNWYVVLRPFEADNGLLQAGEVVDASQWTHKKSLAERRFIQPLNYGIDVPQIKVCEDGKERRMLASEESETKRPTPTRKKQ